MRIKMTTKTCDICGQILDEDYTRYHFHYNLDFTGTIPHQSTTVNGMKMVTLLCYIPPEEHHMNLCEDCGREFKKSIIETKNRLKSSDIGVKI
jgi:hypothetical protein